MNDKPGVLIIAEAGVNHNGSLELAKRLVDVAAEAGADLVKFQTFKAREIASGAAKRADYQTRNDGGLPEDGQLTMLERLELSAADHDALVAHCSDRGIGFFSTGFDLASLDYLQTLGFDQFKVPSGEITNLPYLRKLAGFGRNLILSTGMATLGEIEAAIDARGGWSLPF